MKIAALTLLSLACASLLGCGGSGSGVSQSDSGAPVPMPPAVVNQSPAGIWEGTTVSNGATIQTEALVAENGKFYAYSLNESNDCAEVATGNVSTSGNSLSGTVVAALVSYASNSSVQTDCTYPDGSTYGSGVLSGPITQQSTAAITDTFTTSRGTTQTEDLGSLTFDALYDEASSFTRIAGNWLRPSGDILTIRSDGSVFEQDAATGCVVNGQYSIIDSAYNVYSVSEMIDDCTGAYSVLNGASATGLVTLDDTVSPSQLEGGVSGTLSDGTTFILVSTAAAD